MDKGLRPLGAPSGSGLGSGAKGLPALLIAALWFGAGMMLIKALGPDVPVSWVAFTRNALPFAFLLLWMRKRGQRLYSPQWPLLLLRALWGLLAMLGLYWALPRMPMAEAMVLSQSSPAFTAVLGVSLFGERMEARDWLLVGLAMLGVYVTFRPAFHVAPAPALAALGNAVFFSLAFAALKSLRREEPSLRVVTYFSGVGALLLLPAAWASPYRPNVREAVLMALVGATSGVGQLFLTAGIKDAPLSRGGVLNLALIVVNILGGWLFWGERPGAWTWLGCAMIGAGIWGMLAFAAGQRPAAPSQPPV